MFFSEIFDVYKACCSFMATNENYKKKYTVMGIVIAL